MQRSDFAPTPVFLAVLMMSGPAAVRADTSLSLGPIQSLACSPTCEAVGGVVIDQDTIGLVISMGDGTSSWQEIDINTHQPTASEILGDSSGVEITDVTSDKQGGAWIVGAQDGVPGIDVPGRWHTSDLGVREQPLGLGGNADVALLAVSGNGTAVGTTEQVAATKILPDGTAIDMSAGGIGLGMKPRDISWDGSLAAGTTSNGSFSMLTGWVGDTAEFTDLGIADKPVIGRKMNGETVLVGWRFLPPSTFGLTLFEDPFGAVTETVLPDDITYTDLEGMDDWDIGFAFGSANDRALIIDTNTATTLFLDDLGYPGFTSVVDLDKLDTAAGDQWLVVLGGPGGAQYAIATIGGAAPDDDGDGIANGVDNCRLVANPGQIDTDGDLIGNRCDADFNNDCTANTTDLGLFKAAFFGSDPLYDLNGDGIANAGDLGIFKSLFFQTPGPGAPGNACE